MLGGKSVEAESTFCNPRARAPATFGLAPWKAGIWGIKKGVQHPEALTTPHCANASQFMTGTIPERLAGLSQTSRGAHPSLANDEYGDTQGEQFKWLPLRKKTTLRSAQGVILYA